MSLFMIVGCSMSAQTNGPLHVEISERPPRSFRKPPLSLSPSEVRIQAACVRAGATALGSQFLRSSKSPIPKFLPYPLRSISHSRASTMSNALVRFPLSPVTALVLQKGDITQWSVDGSSDAIVNPANKKMLGGDGADGAIHRAAGPDLVKACYKVPEVRPGVRCPTGEARITPGFWLPASHVIHTVGPIYNAHSNPQDLLSSSYRNSLKVAKENNIQYIAFPAISCGVFGYPYEEAAALAISTIRESANDLKEVHFVLYADDIYNVWLNKANELLKN